MITTYSRTGKVFVANALNRTMHQQFSGAEMFCVLWEARLQALWVSITTGTVDSAEFGVLLASAKAHCAELAVRWKDSDVAWGLQRHPQRLGGRHTARRSRKPTHDPDSFVTGFYEHHEHGRKGPECRRCRARHSQRRSSRACTPELLSECLASNASMVVRCRGDSSSHTVPRLLECVCYHTVPRRLERVCSHTVLRRLYPRRARMQPHRAEAACARLQPHGCRGGSGAYADRRCRGGTRRGERVCSHTAPRQLERESCHTVPRGLERVQPHGAEAVRARLRPRGSVAGRARMRLHGPRRLARICCHTGQSVLEPVCCHTLPWRLEQACSHIVPGRLEREAAIWCRGGSSALVAMRCQELGWERGLEHACGG